MKPEETALFDLLYSHASELARSGRHSEAEQLLVNFDRADNRTKSRACDLLGRIKVQEGQLAQARTHFQMAVALDPDNRKARAALDYLPTHSQTSKRRVIAGISAALFGLVVMAFTVRGYIVHLRDRDSHVTVASLARPPAIPSNHPDTADAKQSGTSESSLLGQDAAAQSTTAANVPETARVRETKVMTPAGDGSGVRRWPSVGVLGVTVSTNDMGLAFTFDGGLFSYRCEMSDTGSQVLGALAQVLKPQLDPFCVLVEGHTDPEPVPQSSQMPDNYSLGLRRAMTVAEILRSRYGLAANKIVIASKGEQDPPFPGDDYDTKLRNRTVVLRLVPISDAGDVSSAP